MSLASLFSDLATHMQSAEFHELARHPDHPTAFTRRRKLPLPSLVAVMVSGMRKGVQAELDSFFGHLQQGAHLIRHVSEQAFALARAKLSLTALPALNDWLIGKRPATPPVQLRRVLFRYAPVLTGACAWGSKRHGGSHTWMVGATAA